MPYPNKDLFIKPKVFVSKCLGFEACRWNGEIMPDSFVEKLKPHVEYITTCPEVEIGLGVPRDPIRVIFKNNKKSLVQLNTKKDVTAVMQKFAAGFLGSLSGVDGFILKGRSPSCGIKDVKIYPSLEPSGVIKKGTGFFGQEVLERFPCAAIETEERLSNYPIREHFLTKLFTMAKFREIKKGLLMKDLVQFQAENKLLLMAYSQKELRLMGKLVANFEKKKPRDIFAEYETHLDAGLANMPKYKSNINVLMHALGYFSDKISSDEKHFFLNSIEEYRREQVPFSVPLSLIRSYIVRFKEDYLMQQSFFGPYPIELSGVRDSGKGRI